MTVKRPYVMRARAEASEETRRRIIAGAIAVYYERPGPEITLEQIAERAGVSVQTILRAFGSRALLLEAAGRLARAEIAEERKAPPGDVTAAIRALFDHYERRGPSVLRLLAQETITGAPDLSAGRHEHRRWIQEVFGPQLRQRPLGARESLVDQLVVATDVYMWKLLCVDRGLERGQAEARVRKMIKALLGAG